MMFLPCQQWGVFDQRKLFLENYDQFNRLNFQFSHFRHENHEHWIFMVVCSNFQCWTEHRTWTFSNVKKCENLSFLVITRRTFIWTELQKCTCYPRFYRTCKIWLLQVTTNRWRFWVLNWVIDKMFYQWPCTCHAFFCSGQ